MIEFRFVDGGDFVSDFIKFWTWGDWSHVDIKTPTGWLGARSDGGVQIRPWDYTTFVCEEIRGIELDPALEAQIMEWYYSQIGKPYDYTAIIGMPFRRDWNNSSRWFCSEYAIGGCKRFGVDLLKADHLDRVTPRDMYLSPLLKP